MTARKRWRSCGPRWLREVLEMVRVEYGRMDVYVRAGGTSVRAGGRTDGRTDGWMSVGVESKVWSMARWSVMEEPPSPYSWLHRHPPPSPRLRRLTSATWWRRVYLRWNCRLITEAPLESTAYTCTHTHIRERASERTHTNTYIHTRERASAHTHPYTHTHTHTHTQKYKHKYT